VDPTVEAALIAVVGTVVVATTGFLTTWAVTRRTNDAAAESALRARLWERQAAVYIEIIKAVEERKGERREWLRLISMGAPSGAYVESARWHALFPRLVAYIAPPVRDALDAAAKANSHVRNLYEECSAMARLDREAAVKRIRTAVAHADAKDQELFETIRTDLRKRPGEARAMTDAPGTWEVPS
jgi:hypothetical protein